MLFVAGCGESPQFKVVKVNGNVLVDDKPMAGIGVMFSPVDAGQQPCGGVTDANGNFVVTTGVMKPGAGAMVGKYNVVFSKGHREGARMSPEEYDANFSFRVPGFIYEIPKRYRNPATSGIEPVDVTSDPKKNDFKFVLTTEGLDKDNAGLATVKAKKK
ncbi:hypothetical protein FACS189454_03860 [Planctomycetales bacterium]|nr:hypothetical protein FACS189454_03860 [Planctomycetales bacterium]